MKFEELRLAEPILRAVTAEGYTTPTPIQIKAIPHVLQGSDLLGCAQTGTGKTAAFALPILHRLAVGCRRSAVGEQPERLHANHKPTNEHRHPRADNRRPTAESHEPKAPHHIRALILCPTRELAAQIGESFRAYGRNLPLKHTVIFGGVNQHHQVQALRRGVDILVATPGRLLDLMNQRHVDLKAIEILVLDEADRMLDMGFIPDIRRVVARIPKQRQTLMFSATMPSDIRALADSILNQPVSVHVNPVASTVDLISQAVYFVQRHGKPALLKHLIKDWKMGRTLVFTRTKHGADKVVKGLMQSGIRAEAIHGNKSQNHRTRALSAFKSHTPPVLVATDIASRGIDVDDVTHVINYDIPNVPETYVHRIGRTARAGASGVAVSFCDPIEERGDLKAIERLIRTTIEVRKDQPAFTAATDVAVWRADQVSKEHATHGNGRSSGRGGSGGNGRYAPGGSRSSRHGTPGGRPRGQAKSSSRAASAHDSRTSHAAHQSLPRGRDGGSAAHGSKPGFQTRGRGRGRVAGRSR
jgi:ATP-dependent RNA helicase RhlE